MEQFLQDFSVIPLIATELSSTELEAMYRTEKKPSEGLLRAGDLGKLDQEDFLKELIEKLRLQAGSRNEEELRAEREELARLRAEVEAEHAALQRFKSDLDTIDADTSIEDLARGLQQRGPVQTEHAPSAWWKEIGLVGNPFPTYTGLDDIPEEKYDDVVVQTSFFKKQVEQATRDPASLIAKTVLVSGEFGSGKTTLFQYLASTLGRQGIIPIEVDFVTYDQTESLIKDLVLKICDSLSQLFVSRFGEDPRRDSLITDPITLLTHLCQRLQEGGKTTGFLVCVDGLHKGSIETRSIFTFLQQIQNLQESLSHSRVRVGFLIAGSPLWDRAIEQSPSLSGSFHRRDIIPPLDESSAVQAVEKRINAFSGNSVLAPSVNQKDLRRSFQILSQRIQRPLTFRDFLKDTGNRLEARAFSDAGVSLALHFETVEAVQAFLAQSEAGKRLRTLLQEIGASEAMRDATQELLLTLLEKGGVSERGVIYQSLKPAFFLLQRHGLIRQRRGREGETFEWTLAPDLKAEVANIAQRLAISAKSTLRAALEESSTARRAESGIIYEAAKQAITSLLPAWKDQWPTLVDPLERCLASLEEIDALTRTAQWRSVSERHFTDSITQLVTAIDMVAFGPSADIQKAWTLYKDSWFAPENVNKILAFSPAKFRLPTNESSFFGALQEHNDAVTQLLRELRDFLQGEAVCRLANRRLSHEEFASLHRLRKAFGQFSYRQVVDGVAELVESRLRTNAYISLRAAWGDAAFDRLPVDIRTSVERLPDRGHPRTRRGRSANFLYDVSRSEYSKILFESNLNRCVFGPSHSAMEKSRLRDSVELIFSLDDRRAHRESGEYFKDHATEIGACLGALPWILESFHEVSMRLLKDGGVSYTQLGADYVEGKFFATDGLTPPPVNIRIPTPDIASLRSLFLRRCEQSPIVIQDSSNICLSSTTSPEIQALSLRSLVTTGLLTITWLSASAPTISVTAKGSAALAPSS